jgi:hypothetical protein
MKKLNPKIIKIAMDANLNDLAEIFVNRTIVDKKRVKNVKLKTNPVTTPSGRLFPVTSTEDDNMIGKIGSIHGDKIVTTPARKANMTSKIMMYE